VVIPTTTAGHQSSASHDQSNPPDFYLVEMVACGSQRQPFKAYQLPINDLVIAQVELGNEIDRTDKIRGRTDPVAKIGCADLPNVTAERAPG
jgi:hypothetical protein